LRKKLFQLLPLILAACLLVLFARPNAFSLIAGGVILFIGEGMRVWASGHLIRNKEVTTSGPYAYVRDPLYLGRLLLLIGFCVMGWGYNWILLVVGLGIFFMNYMPRKYRKEIARLEDRFGEEYRRYASYTRSLIPRLKPYPHASSRLWSFSLFWHENREQYLLSGAVLLFLLLILRYYF